MRAVTKWLRARVLAAAKDDVFVYRRLKQHGQKALACMRAIAERLVGGTPARAPKVTAARLDFNVEALAVGDSRRLCSCGAVSLIAGAQMGFPLLVAQARIMVFDGNVLSNSFLAVSMPATGSPVGSSFPICIRTDA